MIRFLPICAALILLSACSTMVNGPTQEVTIETPGTVGALCFLERPGYKQRVWAPKTIRINKTKDPLKVTCRAPGNREKIEIVEPTRPDTIYLNFANGFIPGALIDYETGALFRFPEKITIDFSDMKPQQMPYPDYEYMLEKNPDLMGMEEFRPGTAALMRDKYYQATTLRERAPQQDLFSDVLKASSVGTAQAVNAIEPAPLPVTAAPSKPAVGSTAGATAESLTRQMNPSVFQPSVPAANPATTESSAPAPASSGTVEDKGMFKYDAKKSIFSDESSSSSGTAAGAPETLAP